MNLKKKLIAEIEKIEDNTLLSQLNELVSVSDDTIEVEFTENQIEKIKESQNQIREGECKPHDEVMKHFEND